ncbi:hypothetical protein PoHVEF18_006506 [Penicillium ochrochloron]
MSNRDYYGDYTPENLSSQDKPQQMSSIQKSDFVPGQTHEQQMSEQNSFNQQNQWKDFDPSTANGTPEGERGLGATVVGGAGLLCRDEQCKPGLPVNPSHAVFIKDLHGTPPTAADAKQWLNNNWEGGHIGKTPTFANAGKFSFTKWPCGKYCLAGFNGGLWQACPNENPGLTQYAEATEACLEFDVTEVPCNIRDDANNCLWNSGKNQCCGKVDCFTDK